MPVHGKRPPPPPRHGSSGYGPTGSGGGNKKMFAIALGLLAVPVTAIAAAVGYVLHGNGVI